MWDDDDFLLGERMIREAGEDGVPVEVLVGWLVREVVERRREREGEFLEMMEGFRFERMWVLG